MLMRTIHYHCERWARRLMVAGLWLLPSVFGAQFSVCRAQSSDFGMWYEIGAEKKLSPKWTIGAEAELRTRNNSRTLDRWTVGLTAEYKIVKKLKAAVGYVFMDINNQEEFDLKSNGIAPNKWTPSYWGARQRFFVGLQGSLDWNRFSFSLRERYQLTYRHAADNQKYDFDNETWKDVKSKVKHVSRTRLQADYDIPHCKFDPFANAELFAGEGGIQKMRYQLGVDYKLRKQHVFSLTYRFQNVNGDDDEGDANSHLVGLSYKYKF